MRFGPFEILERLDIAGGGFDALARDENDREVRVWVGATGRGLGEGAEKVEERLRAISKVYHPSLPRVLAVHTIENRAVFVLQPYHGRTLATRLGEGPMDVLEAIDRARAVAAALVKAHRVGIVHGAIDEREILISDDGRTLLLHLGLAPFLEERPARAPEDFDRRGTESADVFGVSRVLVRCLEGRDSIPDPASPPIRPAESFPSALPEGLRRLLARAVRGDLEGRLHRAEELSGDLGVIRASWDSLSVEPPRPTVPFALVGRPVLMIGALAVALLAVLLALKAC